MSEAKHKRCELCADNPPEQPHCWLIECDDELDEPYAGCRHCPATAEVCPDCDGEGVGNHYIADGDYDEEADCITCHGWGVLPPKEVTK